MDSVSILGPVAPSPTAIPFFLPTVPAGFPSPAQDHLEQRISLDELFRLHRPQIYLAQVSGHSLTGLGILDGDLVLIDKALQPRREDVVIACLNGDPLIKIFDLESQQVVLRSANPAYPPRYVLEGEELHIWGVYIGLCRRGRNGG
ncbi:MULTISPECIES: LexA family protein [Pseudomonadaceae]|uniref:LexA family protein n=1 Tax=Pseudomonadaceae TaxID=135621 RepID=UPI0025AA2731|nr:S24 family peptidase [Pseudomonas wenzhouensis]MDM9653910.1 S24 family peptidase [Pseudomonas wenzhouensis]